MSAGASLPELWPHWQSSDVAYEDDDIIVVDKPAGLELQPSDHPERSELRPRLARWLSARDGGDCKLSLLHPFDREASGLVLLSKRKEANKALAEQLARGMSRSYLALVGGGRVGKARRRLAAFEPEELHAERDHRLWRLRSSAAKQPVRRELARAGAPIVGDRDGGGAPASRLMLHASSLQLTQPLSGAALCIESTHTLDGWLTGGIGRLPSAAAELDRRLREAVERRTAIAHRGDTTAFRIVNGAGDGLPGVDVDVYGRHAVVALRSDEAVAARERLLDVVAGLGFAGIYLKLRPKQANVLADTRRAAVAPPDPVRGDAAPDPLVVLEAGVPYEVRLGDGLSTGLFLDQRANREAIRTMSTGKRVLNLFAYHGAFSCAAVRGGAAASVTIDSAAPALDAARGNLQLLDADMDAHALVRADAQRWLRAHAEPLFDLVILDPPSYSTTKRSTFRAARDYPELAAACLRCLAPGGVLLACTNHRGIVPAKFRRQLQEAAGRAQREITDMTAPADPTDFPAPPGEACHLKSLLVTVAP